FYVKRFISTFTARRVPLGSYNNNIGAPVVSYLSHEQFVNYCRELGGELVLVDYKKRKIGKFWRIVGMKKRGSSVVAIKKPS
ncbi:MAG: hypothetical protein LBG82_04790, partial [Clostridiales Family XIII bacterium]|nr:hypothetical protein [Clostridiales Family XIII bacterium]